MSMAGQQQTVYFVGYNGYGECGLDHTQNLKQLTKCPNASISKVFSSNAYTIWTDHQYDNLWASGFSEEGQCAIGKISRDIQTIQPITYFQQNKIKIKKICVNMGGTCTFFISHQGKLYGCGANSDGKLGLEMDNKNKSIPQLIEQLSNVMDAKSSEDCCIALCSMTHQIKLNQHILKHYKM